MQNVEFQVSKFEWKDTIYGSKVAVYLENNTWFYLPARMTKSLTNQDPYLTMMNNKKWRITFKGRSLPNGFSIGSAIFELKYD